MNGKRLLFSVTAQDCEWSYTRGTGAGGQKRNKTSSAVHCQHQPSGAHGYCESSRSQHENKIEAFRKMCESKEFKRWHSMEVMKRTGQLAEIDAYVKETMKHVKIEQRRNGVWVEFDDSMNTN